MSDTSTTGRAPEPTAMRPSVAMSTMAPWRHRIPRRMIIACAVICAACVAISLLALSLGDYPLSIPEVVSALFGDQGFATTVVTQWRAPRVVAGLVFGAALGLSGALFQTLTDNPLGSPDVIGFSTGSYTGVLIVTTLGATSAVSTSVAAVVAGIVTALVIYLLAWRGGVQGFRLIVVGIAATAMLTAVNTFLLLRMRTEVAMSASIWGAGTLSLVSWAKLTFALPAAALLVACTVLLARPLRQLELGNDTALAHGTRVESSRLAILVVGVGLVAVVTAAVGPIAFISLSAPQVARRLARSAGIPLLTSAFTGALLLVGADVVAQHLTTNPIPVGIVTIVIGGAYLLALLFREARSL
ncbi:FecCD family ABC transporter permease [Propionibacterium freudenreichii]|uniref:FecCD family ABC transporter permease n=2 Tax=Propionibacterium TaxID=1743 RepID=UPI0004A17C6F|nr:iron chelate uptake ABC transporter family permease subunit [Propionibacterium freudenreichii]MDN6798898.1 iron chelate uptake ABC transporter family permease subunit [Propionibacterium sp.]AJQ89973.1 Ferric enterobactin transport system permease protein fepG [Propionibacterium freudenreichii subsp. freudenreichii]AWY96515.1 Ferric enterobactin transport system permease protein fepG [Propionibacterium freudenreichii]WBF60033.1 iron chelate uptake ABC transporter family permease subunit [Prop